MLKDTAEEFEAELRERRGDSNTFHIVVVDEYKDTDGSYNEYNYHYTIRVYSQSAFDEETIQYGTSTSGKPFPQWFVDFLNEHDDLRVTLEHGSPRGRNGGRDEVFFRLDDGETGEIEKPDDVQEREAIQNKIKSQLGINTRPVVGNLTDAFDSFEGIIFADREELMAIDGVGESYSERIVSRYSDAVRDRIKTHDDDEYTPPLIKDQDGTLRLPEEFKDSPHVPRGHTLPADNS